jgi:hypothetical protein
MSEKLDGFDVNSILSRFVFVTGPKLLDSLRLLIRDRGALKNIGS